MSKLRNIIMAAALAVSSVVPLTAEAAPLSPVPLNVEKQTDVTDARIVCNYYGCRRVWRPRVWVAPRVIIRPAPRVIIGSGYNRHVRWCLNHYASYNPATNRFISYGGRYKVCRSPWG